MLRRLLRAHLIAITFIFGWVGAAQASKETSSLRPHRALYSLTLHSSTSDKSIVGVDGAFVIEWRRTCTGWQITQNLRAILERTNQAPRIIDVRYSGWESEDGRDYRFKILNGVDNSVALFRYGWALLPEADRPGKAHVLGLDGIRKVLTLPAGTAFPAAHLQKLISAAAAGVHNLQAFLFDGAGSAGISETHSFISAHRPALVDRSTRPAERYWGLAAAFFPLPVGGEAPDYEVHYRINGDGLVRDLVLDYGAVALDAGLSSVEWLEASNCAN